MENKPKNCQRLRKRLNWMILLVNIILQEISLKIYHPKTEQIRATANILATSSEDDANDHESPCNKRAKISEKEGLAKPDKINSNNLYKQEWIKKLKLQNDNVQNLGTLEPKDIIFEDAVWYQYDANLKFYPGRIESIDYIRNKAQIRHKTGTVEVNIGDVYYLNLLIGDHVDCGGYTGRLLH